MAKIIAGNELKMLKPLIEYPVGTRLLIYKKYPQYVLKEPIEIEVLEKDISRKFTKVKYGFSGAFEWIETEDYEVIAELEKKHEMDKE